MDNENLLYACRVCGLTQIVSPWGEDGRSPTFDFCPCCGVEFGYEDCKPEAAKKFRNEWLKRSDLWNEPKERPDDWSLENQLTHIPNGYGGD